MFEVAGGFEGELRLRDAGKDVKAFIQVKVEVFSVPEEDDGFGLSLLEEGGYPDEEGRLAKSRLDRKLEARSLRDARGGKLVVDTNVTEDSVSTLL